MIATIWTQEGCMACDEEKALLRAEGYAVTEIIVDDPDTMNRDAFLQLRLQNDLFPVARIGDEFRIPASVSSKMDWDQ